MRAAEIARALGGQVAGRDSVLAPGPGHSPRDRSLSVRIDSGAPDGFIVYSHSGDEWQLCRDYVRERLGLPAWQPGDEQNRRIPPQHVGRWDLASTDADAHAFTEDDLIRVKRAQALWHDANEPRGTIAETYLRSRCLSLSDDLAGTVLRFHPRCPWRNENTGSTDRVPALIAAFRSIEDDTITAIHRICLDGNANKLGRRMLGVVHRAAVKLDQIGGVGDLAIGEGIETGMAARQLGVGAPVWALGSVGSISFFPVLEGVRRLLILAESGEASAQAIRICGRRWQHARRRVTVIQPTVGDDLNAALVEGADK